MCVCIIAIDSASLGLNRNLLALNISRSIISMIHKINSSVLSFVSRYYCIDDRTIGKVEHLCNSFPMFSTPSSWNPSEYKWLSSGSRAVNSRKCLQNNFLLKPLSETIDEF